MHFELEQQEQILTKYNYFVIIFCRNLDNGEALKRLQTIHHVLQQDKEALHLQVQEKEQLIHNLHATIAQLQATATATLANNKQQQQESETSKEMLAQLQDAKSKVKSLQSEMDIAVIQHRLETHEQKKHIQKLEQQLTQYQKMQTMVSNIKQVQHCMDALKLETTSAKLECMNSM